MTPDTAQAAAGSVCTNCGDWFDLTDEALCPECWDEGWQEEYGGPLTENDIYEADPPRPGETYEAWRKRKGLDA